MLPAGATGNSNPVGLSKRGTELVPPGLLAARSVSGNFVLSQVRLMSTAYEADHTFVGQIRNNLGFALGQ